jgi:hypothetical protein
MLAVILVLVVGTIRLIGSNANTVFSQAACEEHQFKSLLLESSFGSPQGCVIECRASRKSSTQLTEPFVSPAAIWRAYWKMLPVNVCVG